MSNGTKITQGELNSQNTSRPVTGTSPGSGLSLSPRQTGTFNVKTPATSNVDRSDTKARIGDWVMQSNGSWKVVPDSKTDLTQRLAVIHGGANKKQDVSFGDVVGAVTSTVGEAWMADAAASHIPVIGALWQVFKAPLMIGRMASKVQDAEKRYQEEWLNQELDYDIAADRVVNDDGTVTWKVNYDKMKDAGYGSGSDIKKYTDTADTKAMVLGNGSVLFDVSPVFAASERYSDFVDKVKEQFPNGISRDEANAVVDEETGQTLMDKLTNAVKAEEQQFYYNAQSFANLKKTAPTASDEALQEAANTQLIGNLSSDVLSQAEVTIYTEDNKKTTVNAKSYLDGIKGMTKGERDDYMSSIGNRLKSNDISDDEKAVLQAQSNALYAASHDDGEYHGMYERDFFDIVSDSSFLIFPRIGEVWNFFVGAVKAPLEWAGVDTSAGYNILRNRRLSTFYANEITEPLISGALDLYNMRKISKLTGDIENLLRGAGGKVTKLAESKSWFPSFIAQVSADMPIELARAVAYGAAGENFNLWDEMVKDAVADAVFSTKTRKNIVSALNMPKFQYRRYERGTDTSKKYEADEMVDKADKIIEDNAKEIYEDEFDTGDLYPTGTGIREDAGLVEVTANELSMKRAQTMMKVSNKATLKVMELFFDKNAAQARIAIAIKAEGGSVEDFRKALFYAGDIKEVSRVMMNNFTRFSSVKTDYKEMGEKILKAVGDKKDLTQDDINYINASANRHRFLAENKGDKDAEDYIHKHYDKYIDKVDPERAKELDDIMVSMRKMASNVLDYYVDRGLISKEEAKKMRNSPAYKGGMFMPVWSKGAGVNGKWAKEISQSRAKTKKVFNKEELIAVEDLESPLTSLDQYISNAMRNVAINEKAMFFRDMAAKYPGMDIHLYADTGGSLEEVENLKDINKDFAKKYNNIVATVKQEYPSHQKWMTLNGDLVMDSKALKTTGELKDLKNQNTVLKRKLTRLVNAQNRYMQSQQKLSYVDENGVKVKDVDINGNSTPVDVEIADQIEQLGKLGITTTESSSGIRADRENKKGVKGGYIQLKADELSDNAKRNINSAAKKAGFEVEIIGDPKAGGTYVFTQSASKRTDAQRRKSWNTFFEELGISKDPVDVKTQSAKVNELEAKFREKADRHMELIDRLSASEGEEHEKLSELERKYERDEVFPAMDEYNREKLKLANAVATGNIKREALPERENLDDMLVLDPEITRKIDELKTKFKTIGDVVSKMKLINGPVVSTDLKNYISTAIMSSIGSGAREAIGGAPRRTADKIVDDIVKKIYNEVDSSFDDEVDKLFVSDDVVRERTEKATEKVLKEELSDDEIATILKDANTDRRLERKFALESRDKHLKTFEAAKSRIANLGISAYTYVYENPDVAGSSAAARAFGYYDSDRSPAFGVEDTLTGESVRFTTDDSTINLVLSQFDDAIDPSLSIQSTIIHEYAHAAFDRANNRVPILMDIIYMIKPDLYDRPDLIEQVANSRDATELVAYVTQKKFLDEMNGTKTWHWEDDSTVQGHLDSMFKNLGIEEENFTASKQRMMNLIKCAVTFVKAKLIGKLRSVDTFNDFYRGLVSGAFAPEMRISTAGTMVSEAFPLRNFRWKEVESPFGTIAKPERALSYNNSLEFRLSDAEFTGLKMAEDIQDIKDQISKNEAKQAEMLDRIKNEAAELIEEAKKMSKGSPVELDTDSFINVELTNALKEAMKKNNDIGQVQNVLNEVVQKANPYVSRNTVIKARTAEAAKKFRKNLNAHMKFKQMQNKKKKFSKEHLNATADKVYDYVVEKTIGGKRNQVKAINDAELTRILNEGGDGHTIRYLVDGKEQRYVLTGTGSEEFVKEFYAPEYVIRGPFKQKLLNASKWIANKKRELTTAFDPTRVLPNIARDWSRGIVTTGGVILLSPDDLRTEAIERWGDNEEVVNKINNGFKLAEENQSGSTFTKSMETPKKNRSKSMIKAMKAENGNAYTRYKAKTTDEKLSMLQDMGEEMTRNRAMETAYYKELIDASARGENIDKAIKQAVSASYFYGREATTNFTRRGKIISMFAQNVPYLSQKFASLESFAYAYLDNPIAVSRALKATVTAYSAMIALALSNDESRKKYYLLTEYDRANNIIIPLTNDTIMTIPLDENIAAFLTPYRRMIESLNGVDPEAFYLWGADFLEALSPLDLTGFSEGDRFNVVRGIQKLSTQVIPTWAMPFLEAWTGNDWYYGTDIRVDEEYVGARTGNYTPTAGELTTKSNNSRTLAAVSDGTGIPQWILQRFVQQYGGNVGQYVINGIDKLTGATQEAQGGKDFMDAIFKPFTGLDSDNVSQAFWNGVNKIEERKKKLQNELRTLNGEIESASGEKKAELQNKRQEKISQYGTDITDFIDQYLSAYEITGGLTKQQANRIWRLYVIYDQDKNQGLYGDGSVEEYYADKAKKSANKKATNLAAQSGIDKYYVSNGLTDYDTSYAMQALKNTVYGVPTQQMVDLANILEDTSDYDNSYTKLRSDVQSARSKLYDEQRWDERDKLAYQYDYKILQAIYPYLLEHGVAETLNQNVVMDYLEDWIIVPSEEQKTAKGKYVPNLGKDAQKEKAFKKQFIKKMLGVAGE